MTLKANLHKHHKRIARMLAYLALVCVLIRIAPILICLVLFIAHALGIELTLAATFAILAYIAYKMGDHNV